MGYKKRQPMCGCVVFVVDLYNVGLVGGTFLGLSPSIRVSIGWASVVSMRWCLPFSLCFQPHKKHLPLEPLELRDQVMVQVKPTL